MPLWLILREHFLELGKIPRRLDIVNPSFIPAIYCWVHLFPQSLFQKPERPRPDMKTQTLLKAYRPQNAGRIVDETALVQHPNLLLPQIRQPSELTDQLSPAVLIQTNGHRVNGKIPAEKVISKSPRAHLGQGAGMRIKFLPGRDKIKP